MEVENVGVIEVLEVEDHPQVTNASDATELATGKYLIIIINAPFPALSFFVFGI